MAPPAAMANAATAAMVARTATHSRAASRVVHAARVTAAGLPITPAGKPATEATPAAPVPAPVPAPILRAPAAYRALAPRAAPPARVLPAVRWNGTPLSS